LGAEPRENTSYDQAGKGVAGKTAPRTAKRSIRQKEKRRLVGAALKGTHVSVPFLQVRKEGGETRGILVELRKGNQRASRADRVFNLKQKRRDDGGRNTGTGVGRALLTVRLIVGEEDGQNREGIFCEKSGT